MRTFRLTFDLYTNFHRIDEQHMELFERLNQLLSSVSSGKEEQEVRHFLSFLKSYVLEHFALEEGFMAEYDYPQQSDHLAEHVQFKENLATIESQFDSGKLHGATLVERLESEIGDWFVRHISRSDKALTGYLAAQME